MNVIGVATTHTSEELLKYVNEIIMNFEAAEDIVNKLERLYFGEGRNRKLS
jgi:hypothetical protein